MKKAREDAITIFHAAVAAVQPQQLLPSSLFVSKDGMTICGHKLPLQSWRHLYVIGAGKASSAMAQAVENALGELITEGLVTAKNGHWLPTKKIRLLEAAHPVPDDKAIEAVSETLKLLQRATEEDIILCLISGGASALWCDVPQGVTLAEVRLTFDLLLKSGADIHEVNTVRKHLSGIKGGQLVRHCGGARVFSLIVSDVPGDDLAVIASGPTVADPSTFKDAYAVLLKYNLQNTLPRAVLSHLQRGQRGLIEETPKPGDPLFDRTVNNIIGTNSVALQAAEQAARHLGYRTFVMPGAVTGNAEVVAKTLVALAASKSEGGPICLLQGGETTVHVSGNGKGGRNQQLALSALHELNKMDRNLADRITILSGGTDGTDGPTDAAGAVVDREVRQLVAQKNLPDEIYLRNNDAYTFFSETNSLLMTGPTQTNVMDIMIALVNN